MIQPDLFALRKGPGDDGIEAIELACAVIERAVDDIKNLEKAVTGKTGKYKTMSEEKERFRYGLDAFQFLLGATEEHRAIRDAWCYAANIRPEALLRVKQMFPRAYKLATEWGCA